MVRPDGKFCPPQRGETEGGIEAFGVEAGIAFEAPHAGAPGRLLAGLVECAANAAPGPIGMGGEMADVGEAGSDLPAPRSLPGPATAADAAPVLAFGPVFAFGPAFAFGPVFAFSQITRCPKTTRRERGGS